MTTTSAETGEDATIEWSIKNGEHHMKFVSNTKEKSNFKYSLLIKDLKKELWFLSEEDAKSAYKIPYQVLDQRDLGLPLNSVVKMTEETKKIAGFECKKYKIISTNNTVHCWIAVDTQLNHNDFPSFMRNGSLFGVLKLNGIKGIPLTFEVKDIDGKILNGQYINNIKPTSLSKKIFEVPSNYEVNPTLDNDK